MSTFELFKLTEDQALIAWEKYQRIAIKNLLRPTKSGERQLTPMSLMYIVNEVIERDDTALDFVDYSYPKFDDEKARRMMVKLHGTHLLNPVVGSQMLLEPSPNTLAMVIEELLTLGFTLHRKYR